MAAIAGTVVFIYYLNSWMKWWTGIIEPTPVADGLLFLLFVYAAYVLATDDVRIWDTVVGADASSASAWLPQTNAPARARSRAMAYGQGRRSYARTSSPTCRSKHAGSLVPSVNESIVGCRFLVEAYGHVLEPRPRQVAMAMDAVLGG